MWDYSHRRCFIAEMLVICGAAQDGVTLFSGQLDKIEDLPTIIWDLVMSEKEIVQIETKMVKTIQTATLLADLILHASRPK